MCDGNGTMSPTLLELVVALLLLWLAWQIGKLLAPRFLAALLSFWRSPTVRSSSDRPRPEKNITPSASRPVTPPPRYP